jgi:hypothetical protein
MEELCAEGVASRGGPGSCVDDLRGRGEALTGGGLLSREINDPGCPHGVQRGRQYGQWRYRELGISSAARKLVWFAIADPLGSGLLVSARVLQ